MTIQLPGYPHRVTPFASRADAQAAIEVGVHEGACVGGTVAYNATAGCHLAEVELMPDGARCYL